MTQTFSEKNRATILDGPIHRDPANDLTVRDLIRRVATCEADEDTLTAMVLGGGVA